MEGGGKRKVLSKEARRYRKQVHELQDKIKDMQVELDRIPELEHKVQEGLELQATVDHMVAAKNKAEEQRDAYVTMHDRDVLTRTKINIEMKRAKKKADHLQKVNNSLSERLRLAAKKIEKLATVDSENAKMRLEVEAARFKMERAEKVKAKEADTAKRERQYRLKELFSYEEALERLEDEKKVTAGVREEVKEREAKILELKQELMKVQVDLDAKEKVQEIRTRALHTQKEELARLHEVIKELREIISNQRGEMAQWVTRYKRLRSAFRVMQARLGEVSRRTQTTASRKADLVSPAETNLRLVAEELKAFVELGARERVTQSTHASMAKERDLDFPSTIDPRRTRRPSQTELRDTLSRTSKSAGAVLRNEWGPRPLPSGFHTRNDPTPDCERVAEKPSRRALKAAAGEFDSFLGVGPGTLADTPKHVVTSEGYVIKGDAGVGASMLKGASTDDAMDAVAGNFGVAKPEFKDRKWLQDDAIVAAILQNDKETSKRERAAKRAAKRRMMRVGAPRPPGPPRGEATTSGSMYVGKGLGMRKDAGGRVESQGSVREVLAKILADNPEVARLRKLEKNRLGKWAL